MVQGKEATTGGKEIPFKTWDDTRLVIMETLILLDTREEVFDYLKLLNEMPFNKLESSKIFAMCTQRIKQITYGQI